MTTAIAANTLGDVSMFASDDIRLRMSLRHAPHEVVGQFNLDDSAKRALLSRRPREIRTQLHSAVNAETYVATAVLVATNVVVLA